MNRIPYRDSSSKRCATNSIDSGTTDGHGSLPMPPPAKPPVGASAQAAEDHGFETVPTESSSVAECPSSSTVPAVRPLAPSCDKQSRPSLRRYCYRGKPRKRLRRRSRRPRDSRNLTWQPGHLERTHWFYRLFRQYGPEPLGLRTAALPARSGRFEASSVDFGLNSRNPGYIRTQA